MKPAQEKRIRPKGKVVGKPQVLGRFTPQELAALERRASRDIPAPEQAALNAAADAAYERVQTVEQVLRALRAARLRAGLTQAQVDDLTGIGRANLSRLENMHLDNPTLDTILRYAQAVGLKVTLGAEDAA